MTEPVSTVKDMVAYQDGSIVSKEIIKKPTGTVSIFAFDQDQGLSEHTAPFDALVQILDGEAEITISGEPYRLKADEKPTYRLGKSFSRKISSACMGTSECSAVPVKYILSLAK